MIDDFQHVSIICRDLERSVRSYSSCHDVHGTGNDALLLKPANVICLEYHGPGCPNGPHVTMIEQHTHHKAGSAGGESCTGCHKDKFIAWAIQDLKTWSNVSRWRVEQ